MKKGWKLLLVVLALGCEGPEGPMGKPGADGKPGVDGKPGMDGKPAAALPDCPDEYERDQRETQFVLCRGKGGDEVVRVGRGRSAFWIDRYEASLWDKEDGGKQYGLQGSDYPVTFPGNGQYKEPLYALSKAGVTPSSLTWFQAEAACRASGKRLPTRGEWLAAAQGTPDPGENNGTGGLCITKATTVRNTGSGNLCRSRWGAEDMIGNHWEWTDEWYASVGSQTWSQPWPEASADYGRDGTLNVVSKAARDHLGEWTDGIPAAALRGGHYADGIRAGIFALTVYDAPSRWVFSLGARCVIPR